MTILSYFVTIMALFLFFIWAIVGSIWVYGIYERVILDIDQKGSANYCERKVYILSFTFLTIYWCSWFVLPASVCVFYVCVRWGFLKDLKFKPPTEVNTANTTV
jgi:hypothetical protein